ncbi:MAG TPA: class I SAM-dependent methyltransferase [Candidatus Sulfotelmatobacter sp.]|nr:class I SAM-dependent methyltransferase [Candidatus Sulfotelmatobacter sp.]
MSEPSDHRERPCPLCGGFERKRVMERDGWQVVQCESCGMVFIGNQPLAYDAQAADHDWVEDHSKEASRRKKDRPLLMFFSLLTRPFLRDATTRQYEHAVRWGRGGKLLDLGCGDGRTLALAARKFEVMGVELSAQAAAAAKARVPDATILVGPVTQAAVPEGAFDMVTQFGYIEHEWQPKASLKLAWRALKPGGILLTKTPNYASWNRSLMGANWCGFHIPQHVNYFTPATFGRMLREAGFEPLRRPLLDSLPTSDTLWMAARKPAKESCAERGGGEPPRT